MSQHASESFSDAIELGIVLSTCICVVIFIVYMLTGSNHLKDTVSSTTKRVTNEYASPEEVVPLSGDYYSYLFIY